MELLKTQQCPYCKSIVEDCHAKREGGSHEVECDSCNKKYQVEPIYKFKGFEIQKICNQCNEVEEECYCNAEEAEK
ncbi:hypothetical protein P4159_28105 [Bacillus thuringiensis]|uniref:hypothetical protein n=1 Tax=Bacillus thuringiensis TaxID=1428 RepID=UPI0007C1AD30|nr:hypothetical protein [Bacillus thuringiensis]AND11021.1 hypothetical protein Bt4C1_27825 [Bacillus thuringiensis serovar alesti]MEC3599666.1 hypothetical protein [Bacillus thuringiensis]MED1834212.1 hypothetical protein [Bacillus thuringiensis]MED2034513.1 hypothetical protein [Bacillus thuringiensis]MED2207609.1 hypothetical protein [Bacillus thuringiensis]